VQMVFRLGNSDPSGYSYTVVGTYVIWRGTVLEITEIYYFVRICQGCEVCNSIIVSGIFKWIENKAEFGLA